MLNAVTYINLFSDGYIFFSGPLKHVASFNIICVFECRATFAVNGACKKII
jgi:hypothetical protein